MCTLSTERHRKVDWRNKTSHVPVTWRSPKYSNYTPHIHCQTAGVIFVLRHTKVNAPCRNFAINNWGELIYVHTQNHTHTIILKHRPVFTVEPAPYTFCPEAVHCRVSLQIHSEHSLLPSSTVKEHSRLVAHDVVSLAQCLVTFRWHIKGRL